MFKTDLKYIYVTRDSDNACVYVWDTNIGIKKFKGCVWFASAHSTKYGGSKGDFMSGCIGSGYNLDVGGDVPAGTAWLINTSSGLWTRVDQDMALLDPDTGERVR